MGPGKFKIQTLFYFTKPPHVPTWPHSGQHLSDYSPNRPNKWPGALRATTSPSQIAAGRQIMRISVVVDGRIFRHHGITIGPNFDIIRPRKPPHVPILHPSSRHLSDSISNRTKKWHGAINGASFLHRH